MRVLPAVLILTLVTTLSAAWCDVDTSRWGFLLIDVKDTPETWAIPSNSSLVHPHGLARWSSAFGEKNVLDFRVQISTSKDFHDTRAHWYYHFKSPRILSKLLMSHEGGCSHRYPGIGNIAYVKDLMTGKKATTTFYGSRFGASIAPGLGWEKMNRCFKESCPIGFAYLPGYHIDTSGSYSYSVMSGRSGIQDSQTSFVGCDHGKCCACFGPDTLKVPAILGKELPEDVTINDGVANEIKDVIGKLDSFKQEIDNKLTKVNRKSEKKINDVSGKLNNFKQEINNKLTTVNKDVKVLTHKSCKQIWMSRSNKGSGVYQISVGNNQVINVYCRMTSVSSCYGGGWTMVMKMTDACSSYWTSRSTYGDNAYWRNGGLDNRQYKGSTYWQTSFKEICVGMKYGGRLRAFSFSYPASSLYSLIADGKYRQTHVGRAQWKSLIHGSSLQRNCIREGFNIYVNSQRHTRVRMGVMANQENDCNTPDSFVGLGGGGGLNYQLWGWCRPSHTSANAAGNLAQCNADKGNKNARAMAYILVR
ncbi:Hypothetical predicted protein [Paramuricea clavata]|uniref:Uncharacterized protein n=1 Tax=Paramuricea clavata TaxID=317549 RepID=A0A6S7GW38_PARCT|nr:Hypothetical predicted protein [Paramuricea clavata]